MSERFGQKIIIVSMEHDFDANWSPTAGMTHYAIRFHYAGQKRVRKMLAVIICTQEEGDAESHARAAAVFDDIREAILRNTAQFYTRGIKTPTSFHEFGFNTLWRKIAPTQEYPV